MISVMKLVEKHLWHRWGVPGHSMLRLEILAVGLVLLVACGGGGLTRNEAALLARALGEELREQGYSQGGETYHPNLVELAQQSGLEDRDVAEILSKLQRSLLGHYLQDANFRPSGDLVRAIKNSDKLAGLAGDTVATWLAQQGKGRLASQLQDFLDDPEEKGLEGLLTAVSSSDMEYGFFADAGTVWFRDSQTGAYITVTFIEYQGEQLAIVINGVAAKAGHPIYPGMVSFGPLTIERVSMWRDEMAISPGNSSARCCQPNSSRLRVVSSMRPPLSPPLLRGDIGGLRHPPGVGDQSYVASGQSIGYTVRFQNPAEALGPATDITVIAQLDQGFDLEGLLVGNSSHPDAMNVEVDGPGNTITWTFEDIDLPSNTQPPEGEGWVEFSARLLDDVPSGTPVGVRGAVRLGANPPIETNEVVYTVDSAAPDTQVGPLSSVQLSPSFQVPWEGSDEEGGSGIQRVALLASKNGGPFEVVGTTTESPFDFEGEPGATYGLATVGVDRVGHREAMPAGPDIVVTVGQRLSYETGLYLMGIPAVTEQGPDETLAAPGSVWSGWDADRQAYTTSNGTTYSLFQTVEGPGHGLWARFEEKATFLVWGQTVSADGPYSIDLRAGWNLIANPFPSPLPWSLDNIRVKADGAEKTLRQAQALGWVEDYLWGWNGDAYSLVYDSAVISEVESILAPFQGYWIQAHQDAVLVLPPP